MNEIEEANINKLKLAKIIDSFIKTNMSDGWYAPELAQVILDAGYLPVPKPQEAR